MLEKYMTLKYFEEVIGLVLAVVVLGGFALYILWIVISFKIDEWRRHRKHKKNTKESNDER